MSDGDLERIQQDLQRFVLAGTRAIEARVLGTTRVPVTTRLGIYGEAYRSRLIEALQSNYPTLAELLGAAQFASLGRTYIEAHDSRFFSIRQYGHALPAFLATHPDYARAGLLADLAAWEWTMTEVFDATDATPIDAQALARVEPSRWEQLRFAWHPSVRRLQLNWNAPQTWSAISAGDERPAPAVERDPQPWLLWRRELQIYFRSLPADEAAVMDLSRRGALLNELCDPLCEFVAEEDAPARLSSHLRTWIESGLIADVH